MTRKEAIAIIKNHKILHKMNEPRAIYISEALDMAIEALEREPALDEIRVDSLDKNIKNCENCGWWTCKDMNKRRCQYCYKQDEWIPDYDDNNGNYKENITIKADKHIKGYSNNFPLICDLEVIFSNNKEWITLRDNCDNSITVEIKSLIKLLW